jgi:hypothetical protein
MLLNFYLLRSRALLCLGSLSIFLILVQLSSIDQQAALHIGMQDKVLPADANNDLLHKYSNAMLFLAI